MGIFNTKSNKNIIHVLIIIVTIVLLLTIVSYSDMLSKVFEYFDEIPTTDQKLNDFIAKPIYLQHMSQSNKYYLGLSNKQSCTNLKDNPGKECNNNVAILQSENDKSTTFILNKLLDVTPDTYFLSSTLEDITPSNATLNQTLNLINGTTLVCFDGGYGIATDFELEKNDKGMILKFRKINSDGKNENYYLSECKDDVVCQMNSLKYKRICVSIDKQNAIPFKIMSDPTSDININNKQSPTPNVNQTK